MGEHNVIWIGFLSHPKVNHMVSAQESCVFLKETKILICDGKLQEPIRKEILNNTTFHWGIDNAFIWTLLTFS